MKIHKIPVDKIIWCVYCGTELDNEKHGRILELISVTYLKDPLRAEETFSDGTKLIKEIKSLTEYIAGESDVWTKMGKLDRLSWLP